MNKESMLNDAIFAQENREFEGECVSDLSDVSKGFRGLVLHINDHGNITLYRAFKNGSFHEIASRV